MNFEEKIIERLKRIEREVERLRVKESPNIYPIGSIYMSVSSTNPGTLFGGTWEAYGEGKVLVGKAASGTFDTAGATGGAETHTHPLSDAGVAKIGTVGGINVHIHRASLVHNWTSSNVAVANSTGTETSLNYGAGLGGATDSDSTLQPYIVVYMWRRTG